jgi:hypothetical protein
MNGKPVMPFRFSRSAGSDDERKVAAEELRRALGLLESGAPGQLWANPAGRNGNLKVTLAEPQIIA